VPTCDGCGPQVQIDYRSGEADRAKYGWTGFLDANNYYFTKTVHDNAGNDEAQAELTFTNHYPEDYVTTYTLGGKRTPRGGTLAMRASIHVVWVGSSPYCSIDLFYGTGHNIGYFTNGTNFSHSIDNAGIGRDEDLNLTGQP
jgi:hypothetical protein